MASGGNSASPLESSLPTAQEIYNAGSTGIALLALGSILELAMLAIVALRLYTKQFVLHRWTADDFTTILATIFTTACFVVGCFTVTQAVSSSIIAGQASDSFLISTWLTQWMSPLAFIFAKLSFFVLYLQIFRPVKALRIAAWIGAIYCTLLWTFIFFFRIIAITPRQGQPWSVVSTGWGAQANHLLVFIAGPIDVVSDIHILILPLLGLRKLNVTEKQKVGIQAVVLTGLLAFIASIVSLYYRLGYEHAGPTQFSFYTVTTCVIIELQIGICCVSLPAVSALLRNQRKPCAAGSPSKAAIDTDARTRANLVRYTRTPEQILEDLARDRKQEAQILAREATRTDSGSSSEHGSHRGHDMEELPLRTPPRSRQPSRARDFSRSTRHETSHSPARLSRLAIPVSGVDVRSARVSRRGSLLWRTESVDSNPFAALGNNILVSTEVRQETRRSSAVDLGSEGFEGVRTVIESPKEGPRRVESQIMEAMTGAYGHQYDNGHFPPDPNAGWLDR